MEKQMEAFGNVISEHVDDIIKDRLKGQERYIDGAVEGAVNAKLLEKIGVKWYSLTIFLTALALFLAGFTYVGMLKMESVKEKMGSVEKSVQGDIKMLEQMIKNSKIEVKHKPLKEGPQRKDKA